MDLGVIIALSTVIVILIFYVLIRYLIDKLLKDTVSKLKNMNKFDIEACRNYYASMAKLGIDEEVAQEILNYKLNQRYKCTSDYDIMRCNYYDDGICLHPSNCKFKKEIK